MATATTVPAKSSIGEDRFLIPHVDWDGYEALLKIVGNRKSIRATYDRGTVELMSPLFSHDRFGNLFGRMIEAITEELDIPIAAAGSTTLRRKTLDRGLEADESYYVTNVHRVPNSDRIDLDVDPPPDLAVEVEITNSILKRLDIYAALGVPEIWRFDGEALTVLCLGEDGQYAASKTSRAFPFLPLDEVERFLRAHVPGQDTRWAKGFRAWVRAVLLPLYRNPAGPE